MMRKINFLLILCCLFLTAKNVDANLIDYSYTINLMSRDAGDPLDLNGGTLGLSFSMGSDDSPKGIFDFPDYKIGQYAVMGDLSLAKQDGTTIFSDSVSGTVEVINTFSATNSVDGLAWYADNLEILGNPYYILAYAAFEETFTNNIVPFSFKPKDLSNLFSDVWTYDSEGLFDKLAYSEIYDNPGSAVGTPVPEPSTFLLLGGGLAGLAFVVRRRRKE